MYTLPHRLTRGRGAGPRALGVHEGAGQGAPGVALAAEGRLLGRGPALAELHHASQQAGVAEAALHADAVTRVRERGVGRERGGDGGCKDVVRAGEGVAE